MGKRADDEAGANRMPGSAENVERPACVRKCVGVEREQDYVSGKRERGT